MATTRPKETVKPGVDLEAFHEFVEYATGSPEEVQFELGASAPYGGRLLHSLAKRDAYSLGGEEIKRETREYTLPMGAWKEVEAVTGFVDPTDRMEPIEGALAALAAYVNVAVDIPALANEIELDGLETTVRLDFDPRVIFTIHGVDQSAGTFDDVRVEIAVQGDDLTDQEAEILTAGARRSPVWSLMRLAHDMEPALGVEPTPPTAD